EDFGTPWKEGSDDLPRFGSSLDTLGLDPVVLESLSDLRHARHGIGVGELRDGVLSHARWQGITHPQPPQAFDGSTRPTSIPRRLRQHSVLWILAGRRRPQRPRAGSFRGEGVADPGSTARPPA